jgi:hypothetical protein
VLACGLGDGRSVVRLALGFASARHAPARKRPARFGPNSMLPFGVVMIVEIDHDTLLHLSEPVRLRGGGVKSRKVPAAAVRVHDRQP